MIGELRRAAQRPSIRKNARGGMRERKGAGPRKFMARRQPMRRLESRMRVPLGRIEGV
jgi:hypothetical protein